MKPFDERFADKVREVFDHHEEAFDEAAWLLMQERLAPKKKTRILVLWSLLSRAAVVLLLLGGMVFLYSRLIPHNKRSEVASLVESDVDSTVNGDVSEPWETDDMPAFDELPSSAEIEKDKSEIAGVLSTQPQRGELPSRHAEARADQSALPSRLADDDRQAVADQPKSALPGNGLTEPGAVILQEASTAFAESPSAGDSSRLAQRRHEGVQPVYSDYVPVAPAAAGPNAKVSDFNWTVVAGSMMTFAEQQLAGGLGFTGGLMREWKASGRIGISSGLLLAYQQFEVDGMPIRYSTGKRSMDMAPENFSVRTIGNQAYEMLAFDIPLNIQVKLAEQMNSRLYVSAGFSSLLYLQQRMSGEEIAYVQAEVYDQFSSVYRTLSYTSEVSVNANYGAFQRFDFARLLNLSVGYEMQGKKHTAVVEPFIKYPLGTISSRDIRMGMGGISLKYRFGK